MIKLGASTLNIHDGVHAISKFAVDSLTRLCPDLFVESSIEACDAVITNAPAAPPYSFNFELADKIVALKKPIFVLNDADGAPPDCEDFSPSPEHSFGNFIRGGNGIKAYFYREWFIEYDRYDLKFPLLPFELVGFASSNHPKDKLLAKPVSREEFLRRPVEMMFASSVHAKSRCVAFDNLKNVPKSICINLYENRPLLTDYLRMLEGCKIALALEGGGIKCQSHCEVPLVCIMAMPDIIMHESYPWVDGLNCIRLPYDRDCGEGSLVHNKGRGVINFPKALEKMRFWLDRPDALYTLYVNCLANAEHYQLENYFRHFIGWNIIKYL